ncbi:MAG: SDR family oxidoreductase [Candidatus Lindowbacteria bacterium]|nr:SDR family oxidoreductase [Candidatus Lindowbacteria bacterium]
MGELENQVALITGAASGIDLEIARVFHREGARLLLVDRNEDALKKAGGEFQGSGRAYSFVADVTRSSMVDAAVEEAVRRFGKLDILVNGAGVVHSARILDFEDAHWHMLIDVMVHGVFYGIRAAARQMVKQKTGGKIISLSSAASRVPLGGSIGYCTSKAAVNMITEVASVELGKHKIRVNAIAPGETMTPLIQRRLDNPGWKEFVIRETPLRRMGETGDIAEMALFLASNRSDWVTGQVFFVDGGQGLRGVDYEELTGNV